jgi:glycosyltransferase involved in cell wall biosynthesis
MVPKRNPTVAVVVIGRNEGARLTRCLDSVTESCRGSCAAEVIYVDSASSDDSLERASRAGARVLSLAGSPTTAARGRNAGWRSTPAAFVLFLDGDTVLDPGFLPRALAEFADPRVAVVWGHRREIAPQSSLYNRVLDLDWIYAPGLTEFCGGDALMRRDVLLEVGGYDEQLIAGEEPELCRRMRTLGYQILHVDCPMTGHDLAMTSWGQYWSRATRTGFAYAAMSRRFRGTDFPLWQRDARKNLVHGPGMVILPALALLVSWWVRSWVPLAALGAVLLLLGLRTMRRILWKSPGDPWTCFIYGLHSHLQQVPIFFGQMKFYRQRGGAHRLIEYKGVAP